MQVHDKDADKKAAAKASHVPADAGPQVDLISPGKQTSLERASSAPCRPPRPPQKSGSQNDSATAKGAPLNPQHQYRADHQGKRDQGSTGPSRIGGQSPFSDLKLRGPGPWCYAMEHMMYRKTSCMSGVHDVLHDMPGPASCRCLAARGRGLSPRGV